MILGRATHPASACFDELDAALRALTDRVVCLNGHMFPRDIPEDAVVYNLENVPQLTAPALERFAGHELWDFSARNAAKLDAKHVPVGYHPSMERFARAAEQDIDVVFTGCVNERRCAVLDALAERGLTVVVVGPGVAYGAERNALLARAKLALNMLFYEEGTFPALRVAHLVANHVPVLSERCPEGWSFVPTCSYAQLVEQACAIVRGEIKDCADYAYERFKAMPMVLP